MRMWFYTVLLITLSPYRHVAGKSTRNVNKAYVKTITRYVDQEVNPCDDFYQYACGMWENWHDTDSYYENTGLIDDQTNRDMAKLLSLIKVRGWRNRFVGNAIAFYEACLAVEEYEPRQYLHWLEKHEQIKWPLVSRNAKRNKHKKGNHSTANYDWVRLLAVLRKYGLNGVMLEQIVMQQAHDGRSSRIDIDKPVMDGGFKLLRFREFDLYMEYLGITRVQQILQLWDNFHMFEVKLKSLDDIADEANEIGDDDEDDDEAKLVWSLSQLNMTWLEQYLSVVLEQTVDPSMKITIQNLPYMHALVSLVDDYGSEFVSGYLMIRFLHFLNVDGPSKFEKIDCISHTRSMMPLAMNYLYESNQPQFNFVRDDVKRMFRQLIGHFKQTLQLNANHFEGEVLKFLNDKLDNMQIKIGNLPRPSTTAAVEEFYRRVQLSSSDFYANHLQMLRFSVEAMNRLLATKLPAHDDDSFFHLEDAETGASSTPYYLTRSNVVIVPATLLQLPMYHRHFEDIFKYSLLGFLLAHEITHGFDDSGLKFDKHGNQRGPNNRIKANRRFDGNLSCLRGQNPDIIDEKIADVSGLRWAYESYFQNISSAVDRHQRMQLSSEQLFFLNFAQFFCGSSLNEEIRDYSEHGPDRERVLDALANFKEFGHAYGCKVGSRMNPKKKCQLWR